MFLTIISKIIPLYIVALQGFIAGKLHEIHSKSITKLMFHFLLPIIFFDVAVNVRFEAKFFLLPIIVFLSCIIIREMISFLANYFLDEENSRITGYCSASINVNSIGISFALIILNDDLLRVFLLSSLGSIFHTHTVGQKFLIGKKKSYYNFIKIFKMPILIAFIIGLFFNVSGIKLISGFDNLFAQIRSAYLILGMLILGINLISVSGKINYKILTLILIAKTVLFPFIFLSIILLDYYILNIYNYGMYKVLLLFGLLPPGMDCIVTCINHNKPVHQISISLLIISLIATFYIPLIIQFI